MLQAHGESAPRHRLLHDIGVQGQLIAHGRANEIRAVCVEAFLHQQVDVAKIYHAHIHGHLFGLAASLFQFQSVGILVHSIHWESIWNPIGA
ncbi:hypothetical protein D3C76_1747150 [compost metagenome]